MIVLQVVSLLTYIVKCVAVYRIGRFVLNILRAVYIYYIAPILGIGIDFTRYQRKWTVITGCTDGIGEAYLFALAEKGLRKFLLISRNLDRLKDTADRLLAYHNDCRIEMFSFTFGQDDYEKLKTFIQQFEIGVVVNNVGDAPRMLQKFAENYEADKRVSVVNIEPAFELIQLVLPQMKQENEGVIVNISSSHSIRPVPLLASYSASKVYVSYLSECLHREYCSDGIVVQCLVPLFVSTKLVHYETLFDSAIAKYFVTRPGVFARQAVSSLGVVSYTTGCFSHEVQVRAINPFVKERLGALHFQKSFLYLLPWWLLRHLVTPLYKQQQARLLVLQERTSVRH